jgi:hypothetical protein
MLAAAGSHIHDTDRIPMCIQATIQTAETTQNAQ